MEPLDYTKSIQKKLSSSQFLEWEEKLQKKYSSSFKRKRYSRYCVGIIPTARPVPNYDFPWHNILMPIAPDKTAIDRSIAECLLMGCKQIWIVVQPEVQANLRTRLGDFVWLGGDLYDEEEPKVPIFYLFLGSKSIDTRNTVEWSIVWAAANARFYNSKVSELCSPRSFYVSCPYGVYPIDFINEEYLREFAKIDSTVFLSYEDKTIRDGKYLGFYFGIQELDEFLKNYKQQEGPWGLKRIFAAQDDMNKPLAIVEVPWYYGIDKWESYVRLLYQQKIELPVVETQDLKTFKKE